ELLHLMSENKNRTVVEKLPGLEIFIRFGVDIGYIGVQNGELLFLEIGNLAALLQEGNRKPEEPQIEFRNADVDLSDIFAIEESETLIETEVEARDIDATKDSGNLESAIRQSGKNRQSAILERIRQTGNCRLSDIQAILPETSERTIRYDLESLVQQKLIERV